MQMMANLSADLKSRVRGAGGGEGGGGREGVTEEANRLRVTKGEMNGRGRK